MKSEWSLCQKILLDKSYHILSCLSYFGVIRSTTLSWIPNPANTKKYVIQNCKNTKLSNKWWYCYDCYLKTFNWNCSIIFWGLFRSSKYTLLQLRCCDNQNLHKTSLSFIKQIFAALSGSLSTISYLVWHLVRVIFSSCP